MSTNADDVTLVIGEDVMSGWTSARVTRGVERMASDFTLTLTQRYPQDRLQAISPGEFCQVSLGSDLVISGYVDEYAPQYDVSQHSITVTGRSKTQDLIDCSAVWPKSQLVNGTLLTIAQTLALPFSISAYSLAKAIGPVVPQTIVGWGDTPFDILEPLARLRAVLMYDDPAGNLVFADCGTELKLTGLTEGVNVESAGVTYSMRGRYSDWRLFRVKLSNFKDSGNENHFAADFPDPTMTRYRPKFIVMESNDGGLDVATKRAAWSLARSIGRSAAVHVITDSWRDGQGTLWTPNTLVPFSLPSLGMKPAAWLISEVTYIRDAQGTHARLVLMHPDSFKPQPINYQPIPKELADAIKKALQEKRK